jgi:hypothetical protein
MKLFEKKKKKKKKEEEEEKKNEIVSHVTTIKNDEGSVLTKNLQLDTQKQTNVIKVFRPV